MKTLNLGIVAHVDAGKTSLTERLLFAAGVIDTLGRVDDGSTQTDTLALERARGITIKTAVTSFRLRRGGHDEVTVNLIDTPGHPDFVAEVERVLGILDGAVLVVSAVEGVQAQTRILMRTLRRLGVPTVIFVNKIDRRGARERELLEELASKLDVALVSLTRVHGLGTRQAQVELITGTDAGRVEVLAEHSDRFLGRYVAADGELPEQVVLRELARQSRTGAISPVYFGSAMTGAGIDLLVDGLTRLLPTGAGDPEAPLDAAVFKINRDDHGRRIAYLRMFGGRLRVRDRIDDDHGRPGRVTGLDVFGDGGRHRASEVRAGQIATVTGLDRVLIGDRLGGGVARATRAFAPPSLETVVRPVHDEERGALYAALTDLADQDPLIGLHRDALTGDATLSLYGEVQKEVLQATLQSDYGLAVEFSASRTLCIERLVGTGSAVEVIYAEENPFLATVGLRVEPAPVGSGVALDLEVELGSMPLAFFTATEATVRDQLGQGLLGWRVPDCRVVMTHAKYAPRQSHAHARFDKSMSSTGADFRGLVPLVLMSALRRAGTQVCEPVHRFGLEMPADVLAAVLPVVVKLRGVPLEPRVRGPWCVLEGEIPASEIHRAQELLPGLTRGEGVLESSFERYVPASGEVPRRPRARPDALDRRSYLLQVLRRRAT